MIVEFILAMLGGFGLHQTRHITEHMPSGWERLASFVIGVIGTIPFIALFRRGIGDGVKPEKKWLMAYLLGFTGTGAGVSVGWLVDSIREREQERE